MSLSDKVINIIISNAVAGMAIGIAFWLASSPGILRLALITIIAGDIIASLYFLFK
jgi:hypothetical protein